MTTLNRFPLLGLWAKEAARRLGYSSGESEALGHAYAVLYAIRAQGKPHKKAEGGKAAPKRPTRPKRAKEQVEFAGDTLDIAHDAEGKVQGLVGGEAPQTARSYRSNVAAKFPDGYYQKLQDCFRRLLKKYPPRTLNSRLVYDLYDEWKKACGRGRLVDLDRLLEWCEERAGEKK